MFNHEEVFYSKQIENLIKKSDEGQWSLENDIDWNQEVVYPENVSHSDYIDMISQLYYGEILTIQVLSRMIEKLPDYQAKKFLAGQLYEEIRHADAYLKYINKIGKLIPVNKQLESVFMEAINWQGSAYGLVVALNILFEGEALTQQQFRAQTLPCPLFQQIMKRITVDESRHASFGILYLKEKMPSIPTEEKNEIINWVFSMWKNWEHANENRYSESEILQTDKKKFEARLNVQKRILENIGLISVPNTNLNTEAQYELN